MASKDSERISLIVKAITNFWEQENILSHYCFVGINIREQYGAASIEFAGHVEGCQTCETALMAEAAATRQ